MSSMCIITVRKSYNLMIYEFRQFTIKSVGLEKKFILHTSANYDQAKCERRSIHRVWTPITRSVCASLSSYSSTGGVNPGG